MSIDFVILGWIFVTTEFAAKLLVCIGVLDCGYPSYTSAIICGTSSQELTYIASIYDSAANVITTLIIWAVFNTAPLFLGVSSFSDKKKCPPARLLALGSMRYYASLWHANTMSPAWYMTITS